MSIGTFVFILLVFHYTNAQTNTFPSSGNVGIGTSNPRSFLDVKGTALFTSMVNFGGYSDVAMGAPLVVSGGNLYGGGPTYNGSNAYWDATSVGQYLTIDLKGTVYFNAITFGTYWKNDSHEVPAAYHIEYSKDGLTWLNLISVTGNTQTFIYHTFPRSQGRYIRLTVDAFQSGMSRAYISSFRVFTTAYVTNFGNSLWSTLPGRNPNNVILATIGNVLIGKTTQTNHDYKLDVNGNIRANKVVVNTSGADYVFDSTYQLLSLDSLNNYIRKYHHLPEIPSAKEMQRKGLSIGDAYTKLLEKMEEMTRYVIELEKANKYQQHEIEKLKQSH